MNIAYFQSVSISTAVFGCPWARLSKELKRNVALFMAFSQQPIVLTAAKLVPVSVATFTTVSILVENL